MALDAGEWRQRSINKEGTCDTQFLLNNILCNCPVVLDKM